MKKPWPTPHPFRTCAWGYAWCADGKKRWGWIQGLGKEGVNILFYRVSRGKYRNALIEKILHMEEDKYAKRRKYNV